MGQYVFKLPDVGEGTAEAEIVAWHVRVGDVIKEDAPLVDVMTDKATVEMTSPVAGKVISIHGEPGDMAAVGGPIAIFEVEGAGSAPEPVKAEAPKAPPPAAEPAPKVNGSAPQSAPKPRIRAEAGSVWTDAHVESAIQSSAAKATAVPVAAMPAAAKPQPKPAAATAVAKPAAREPSVQEWGVLASPAVRARAQKLGVDLNAIRGTGPEGRVTHEDLDSVLVPAHRSSGGGSALVARHNIEPVKVIGLRRKIAEKMQDAKRRIPHFAYVEEADLTELEELRAHLNATKRSDQPKLTLLPFLMRALVMCLPDFPQINARYDDDQGVVYRHENVDIGIATQTDNGLIVPVVRHAEARDIWDSAMEVSRLAAAVRANTATKEELSGSTITITSLGPLGGIVTTPVINHPEVAIIGVNKLVERPVVKNGAIVIRKMMNLSSSFDHRVVDGYDAAAFIQRVKGMLEHPAALFVDR
ncbi:dihydrolipoamide acetyltransferase family protein [Terricaulis sp.]|uniref:dihydrolipoamide acetyltransferase family protein n=1 Tax=Terricaulis sp. TaxID=2768686 RepID=UPI003782F6F0